MVFVAEDTRLGRQVALKFLPVSSLGSSAALERFRLEARAASALSHPGICAIHDIGVHEGAPYIVMELVKGETLRDRIARGPLRVADVVDIGIQLADALAGAHAQGIVHRDIKPANIVVDEKLRPKLLDFGLAKFAGGRIDSSAPDDLTLAASAPAVPPAGPPASPLTIAGTALGTVSYMSPEQARGEEVDARTDIFSLGVVLYEMVTGQQAFGGATTAVVFDAILNRAPVSPSVLKPDTPPRLVEAIHTALEKDRGLRYQHAEELEAELKRIRRDLQSGTTGTLPPRPIAPVSADLLPAPGPPPAAPAAPVGPAAGSGAADYDRGGGWKWVAFGLVIAASTYWNSPLRRMFTPDQDVDASRAEQRLDARDFRAALVEADAVLARDPDNADAMRVRNTARAQLGALETLASRVRSTVTAGDMPAATRALADAQALAPGDALVTELSVLVRSAAAPPATGNTAAAPARTAEGGAPTAVQGAVPPPVPPAVAASGAAPAPVAPATDGPALTPPRADVEIRRVLDVYRRAVSARDFNLFRSIYPEMTADEEQRFRANLGPGAPQPLVMRVEQLAVTGDTAEARLVFLDPAPGRPARPPLAQFVGLGRRESGWVIVRVGPPRRRPQPRPQR